MGQDSPSLRFAHPLLGPVLLLAPDLMQLSFPLSRPEYQAWQQNLTAHCSISTRWVLWPHSHKYDLNFCSDNGLLTINFPDCRILLTAQLSRRKARGLYFAEEELLYILAAAASVVDDFQGRGLPLGDLSARNVLLARNGEPKLITELSSPISLHYLLAHSEDQERTLLTSDQKLGFLLLETAALEPAVSSPGPEQTASIARLMQTLEGRYTLKLRRFIEQLLNSRSRVTSLSSLLRTRRLGIQSKE